MLRMRFIWPAISALAGCVRAHTVPVATASPVGDDRAVELSAVTRDRTATLVRRVIASDVAPSSAITLSRFYLCIDDAGRECARTAADTVPVVIRRGVRQQVQRCGHPDDPAPTFVEFSRARVRGDSLELYVGLTSGAYGQPGDQTTYRIRGAAGPRSELSDVASITAVYHAQIIRLQTRSGVQPDETCSAHDGAAKPGL